MQVSRLFAASRQIAADASENDAMVNYHGLERRSSRKLEFIRRMLDGIASLRDLQDEIAAFANWIDSPANF